LRPTLPKDSLSIGTFNPRGAVQARPSDVAIIGGGPAGAAAAGLLSAWGHSVTVFSRSGSASSRLAESLPPSTLKILDRIGALSAVNGAGFVRSTGHSVWWGGSDVRIEDFPKGTRGYQVLRSDLDRLLLGLAKTNGAHIRAETTVQSVEREGDLYRLDCATAEGIVPITARWVFDCSGRSGVIARRGLRNREEGSRTLALVGVWHSAEGWDIPDPTHTLVESYTDGWAWSVPVEEHTRYFTLMVDPIMTGLQRGKEIGPIYASEMAKTKRFAELLDGAVLRGELWACNASMYSAHHFSDDHMLLVGDAASFLDPVSSFGVKKALASGWRAAVVAHTCLKHPEMTTASLDFHEGRERRVYASYSRQSAEVFGMAGQAHQHAFWTDRAAMDEVHDESDADGDLDIQRLKRDPTVLTAFDRLRRSPSIDLRAGPTMAVITRPTITDDAVVMEERLSTPLVPGGVRHLRGVDLQHVLLMVSDHAQVPNLFEAYCRTRDPVILPDFLGALSFMVSRGILEES
jgi:flavin-dependent dehydrogenase